MFRHPDSAIDSIAGELSRGDMFLQEELRSEMAMALRGVRRIHTDGSYHEAIARSRAEGYISAREIYRKRGV